MQCNYFWCSKCSEWLPRWETYLCLLLITAQMVDSLTQAWTAVGLFFDLEPWGSQSPPTLLLHAVTANVTGTPFIAVHQACRSF